MKIKGKKLVAVAPVIVVLLTTIFVSTLVSSSSSKTSNSSFNDVKDTDWFYDDVNYMVDNGIMQGTADDKFSPHDKTTRGMIVTVLWRIDGESVIEGNNFEDVNKDDYFYNSVMWASKNNIVSGYDSAHFGANDYATREQLVSILYRYAKYKEYDLDGTYDLTGYLDYSTIHDYAKDAFVWAVFNGIITGTSDTKLSPQGDLERCQLAAILHRFCVKFIDTNSDSNSNENEENDVKSSSGSSSASSGSSSKSGGGKTSTKSKDTSSSGSSEGSESSKTALITVEDIDAGQGSEVEVIVKLDNNPGILGMTLSAYFDEELELESVENGEAFADVINLTTSKTLENGVNFVWDGVDLQPSDIKDGTILKLKFKVSDSAALGKHQIALKCLDGDVVNNNLQSIPLQLKSGYITVK